MNLANLGGLAGWRSSFVVAIAFLLLAGGCAKNPPPLQPGMSGLEVRVIAEPKQGIDPKFNTSDAYGGGGPAGVFQTIDYENVPNILVWLEPITGGLSAPPPTTPIDIGGRPSSAIQPASVGGKAVFTNQSDSAISLYSVSDGNEFDLGKLAPGAQAEYVVRSPGLIEVLSESQTEPIARLYAVPSPWVKTVNSGEKVTFDNLPPGDYRVVCWHERLPGSTQQVTLTADHQSQTTATVSVNLLPPKQ